MTFLGSKRMNDPESATIESGIFSICLLLQADKKKIQNKNILINLV